MDQYLIYLRKSRKDRELELQTGNFDTLQRHRDTLLALARQRGYSIAHIYEEVVSGDTIAERPEMQKLLAAVETGAYAGVLVMEIPRLARGNTRDQGTVAETFQYSSTRIITPDKIYDPADEADEEYFEFGLFMSRREYKAINRRLQRRRMASLTEGKYIAGSAPYGYRRIRIPHQRGFTLEIVPDAAETVREIFHLYTAGAPRPDGTTDPVGSHGIANLLNAQGLQSPGGVKWTAAAVRDILKNPTYAGYIRWSYRPGKNRWWMALWWSRTQLIKMPLFKRGFTRPLFQKTPGQLPKPPWPAVVTPLFQAASAFPIHWQACSAVMSAAALLCSSPKAAMAPLWSCVLPPNALPWAAGGMWWRRRSWIPSEPG